MSLSSHFHLPGAANLGKTPLTLHFLIRWEGCDELDLIPAPVLNERVPELVLNYYEGLSSINRRFDEKEKMRLAMALRPVIVSKVEQMMQSDSVTNEELFQAVVQEATNDEQEEVQQEEIVPQEDCGAMVEIPQGQDYGGSDMPLIQQDDMNWVGEEQTV